MTVATYGEPAGGPGLFQARVLEIWVEPTGDVIITSAAIGANVLQLNSVADFSDAGGTVSINGLVYSYLTRDINLDTLTLTTPLTVAVTDEDKAYVFPFSNERWAHCQIETGQDMVKARVPHGLAPLFFPGIRPPEDRESVYLAQEGTTWVVQNIVGKNPVVGGITFQTAESGNRIEMVDDEGAGDLRFYSGHLDETAPGTIGTSVNLGGSLSLLNFIGPAIDGQTPATFSMRSGDDLADRWMTFNTSQFNVNSDSFYLGGNGMALGALGVAGLLSSSSFQVSGTNLITGIAGGLVLGHSIPGAGIVELGHGLGVTPWFVFGWPTHASRANKMNVNATAVNSAVVQWTARNISSDALATGSIDFYWIAIA